MKQLNDLKIKIFADGADIANIIALDQNSLIKGFTTNPTLMRHAGIENYDAFAKTALSHVTKKPISFEVFSDDFNEMYEQALTISSWGDNVFIKIPIMNTKGESSIPLIAKLAKQGVKQNITAMMTIEQASAAAAVLADGPPALLSIFAGRIADTGRDPLHIMEAALSVIKPYPHLELIWASPREVLNIFQADEIGCDIITVTSPILNKLKLTGKNLDEFSLETVQMFYEDAQAAGYSLCDTATPKVKIPLE